MGGELPGALQAVERRQTVDEAAPLRRRRERGAQLVVGRRPLILRGAVRHGIAQVVAIEHGGDVGVGERSQRVELARGEAQAAVLVIHAGAAEPRERTIGSQHELRDGRRQRRLEREERNGERPHQRAVVGLGERSFERRHQRLPVEVRIGEPLLAWSVAHACSPESTTTPITVAATPANCSLRSRSPSTRKPSTPATTANRLESTAGTATLPLPTPTMNET